MLLATPMSYYSCVFVLLLLISKVNNKQLTLVCVLCLPTTLCYHFFRLLNSFNNNKFSTVIINSTQLQSARLC